MLLKYLKGGILNRPEGPARVNEGFWNKCKTKLCVQSTQQLGQCVSHAGMEESASLCDKMAGSFCAQKNDSFSAQCNKKQSPGNMHKKNHITKILLRLFLK